LEPFDGLVARVRIPGVSHGPLKGRTFVVKDLLDVAGITTGAGNPTWLATHEPAAETASCIKSCLDAGATLIGKSCTDELAFSLDGINEHYGTPLNPQAPDRIPGGSSSGSASAVASGLADFGLGTDTAGSIRVPASYCGIYGMRPTHGRIPMDGIVPLGPSFDTVGWLARDASLLQDCGEVLLGRNIESQMPTDVLLVADGFDSLCDEFRQPFDAFKSHLQKIFESIKVITFGMQHLQEFVTCFNTIRSWEAWQCHGAWLESAQPALAPDIKERLYNCKNTSTREAEQARAQRKEIIESINNILPDTTVLCIPTTHAVPPLRSASAQRLAANRKANLLLCSIASIAGLPQVTIPINAISGIRSGVSFIGRAGTDSALLRLCVRFEAALKQERDTN
jgi:amidase